MTYTFVPPTAPTLPAFLPETKGVEFGLAKYRNLMQQGVVVYKMSDGSYRQDYPTAENNNTAISPYPLMPDQGVNEPNDISVVYTGATPGNPVTRQVTQINPYVVLVYNGGHSITVSDAEAALLSAYTAHGIGYSGCLTHN